MPQVNIPLVEDFYLICNKREIIANKTIPLSINSSNKVEKVALLEQTQTKLEILAIGWEDYIVCEGINIIHFHEILYAFLHNQMHGGKHYKMTNIENNESTVLTLNTLDTIPSIMIKRDLGSLNITIMGDFNKIECRIFTRLLNYYLSQGELRESDREYSYRYTHKPDITGRHSYKEKDTFQ